MSYPTIESTIGNTPLIQLPRIGGEEAKRRNNLILGKLEGNNPAGSVKDRAAYSMITRAEARGQIVDLHHALFGQSLRERPGLHIIQTHAGRCQRTVGSDAGHATALQDIAFELVEERERQVQFHGGMALFQLGNKQSV